MKLWNALGAFILFVFSAPVFGQSIEIMHLSDGDTVDIDGFLIFAKLEGLTSFDEGEFHASTYVLQRTPYSETAIASITFSYNRSFSGRNMKLMSKDVYFPTYEPCQDGMHLITKTGQLNNPLAMIPVEVGDEVIVQVKIWGYVNDEWQYFTEEVPVFVAD